MSSRRKKKLSSATKRVSARRNSAVSDANAKKWSLELPHVIPTEGCTFEHLIDTLVKHWGETDVSREADLFLSTLGYYSSAEELLVALVERGRPAKKVLAHVLVAHEEVVFEGEVSEETLARVREVFQVDLEALRRERVAQNKSSPEALLQLVLTSVETQRHVETNELMFGSRAAEKYLRAEMQLDVNERRRVTQAWLKSGYVHDTDSVSADTWSSGAHWYRLTRRGLHVCKTGLPPPPVPEELRTVARRILPQLKLLPVPRCQFAFEAKKALSLLKTEGKKRARQLMQRMMDLSLLARVDGSLTFVPRKHMYVTPLGVREALLPVTDDVDPLARRLSFDALPAASSRSRSDSFTVRDMVMASPVSARHWTSGAAGEDACEMHLVVPPPLWNPADEAHTVDMMTIEPLELARQLTLMTQEIYVRIAYVHLARQAWRKKRNPLSELIDFITDLTQWAASEVLTANYPNGGPPTMLVAFVNLGYYMLELRNFAGVFAVVHGLYKHDVSRLDAVWAAGCKDKTTFERWQRLEALTSPDSNYAAYRAALAEVEVGAPTVPYPGICCMDLTMIDENQTFVDGVICKEKLGMAFRVMASFLCRQRDPYRLKRVPQLKQWYCGYRLVLTDEQLELQSLKLKKRAN